MPQFLDLADRQKVSIKLDEVTLNVEAVTTEASTAQGLSGRSEIGADGMLFIFPNSQTRRFWMKEMQFPIDIIWIHQQKIIGFTENVPTPLPNTPLYMLPTYASPEAVEMVLEVPAGFVAAHKVELGMQVSLE